MLSFVADDLGDFGDINLGQFDEAGEDVEARSTGVDLFGAEVLFCQDFCQGLAEDFFAGGFLRAFNTQGFDAILLQGQPAGLVLFELRHFEASCAKIYG